MDDNNNVVVVEDKIDTEPRTEQAKQIFSHPAGKARSGVWKTFGFYKMKPGPPSRDIWT